MLSKCANPTCTARLKYLHQGRLFVVQSPSAAQYWSHDEGSFSAPPGNQIEYFWLCKTCARQMKVTPAGCLESLHRDRVLSFEEMPLEYHSWRLDPAAPAGLSLVG